MPNVGDEIKEMLQDLEDEGNYPPLLDTDFTRVMIMEHFHCSDTSARRRAKEMVDSGKWALIWKKPPGGQKVATYKKVVS
jgi:hypothetical protein